MLEESVVYQDILRKGKRQGLQQGLQQEGKTIAVRQLERRFGKLSPAVRRELERLAVAQLEDLCSVPTQSQFMNIRGVRGF